MTAFEVDQDERVLFAFTHPDDEVVVSAFLGRLISQDVAVRLFWTHSNATREAESRAAMDRIGVGPAQLTFFGAEDGRIAEAVPELRPQVAEVIGDFAPTRVVTHAFEQGHIDHDATNLLVHLTYDGPTFESPFYHTYHTRFPVLHKFSDPIGEQTLALTDEERRFKRGLIGLYSSQTIKRNVAIYEMLHTLTFRRAGLFDFERLRRQTHYDYRTPNHPVDISKGVVASATWQRWLKCLDGNI